MTLKQMVDALYEGKKVGRTDIGYMFINIDNKLYIEVFDDEAWQDYYDDELIGKLFREHDKCVIFPEEG